MSIQNLQMIEGFSRMILLRLLVFLALSRWACATPVNITFENLLDVYVYEGQEAEVNVTVMGLEDFRGTMSFASSNDFAFDIVANYSENRVRLEDSMMLPVTFGIMVRGKNLQVAAMEISLSRDGSLEAVLVAEFPVKVLHNAHPLSSIVAYMIYIPHLMTFILIGIAMDLKVIWSSLRRPWAVFIGFVCQFGLMPAMALGIGKMLHLDGATATGLLLVGCCPGGKISNDVSILVDADYNLSVTMTTLSTLVSFGMMPLNIFAYSRLITDSNLAAPYEQIALQLGIMLIPITAGVCARYRWPDLDTKISKFFKPLIGFVYVVTGATTIPFQLFIFNAPWQIFIAGLLLPFMGAVFGTILAKLARLTNTQVLAIAFETGIQNGVVAYFVLVNSYPKPEADLAGRVAFLVLIFQLAMGLLIVIPYTIKRSFESCINDDGKSDDCHLDTAGNEPPVEDKLPKHEEIGENINDIQNTASYANDAFSLQ